MADRREDLRAADVDRQFVADRLKAALDEGRLSLGEYDDRLKETYAARTYGDLDRLLVDLPKPERSQLVPPPPSTVAPASSEPDPAPRGRPRWIAPAWGSWLTVTLVLNAIWLATLLGSGGHGHASYWPIWVMLPWGAVLLAGTISGAAHGGRRDHRNYPDTRQAFRDARRDYRDARRRQRRGY